MRTLKSAFEDFVNYDSRCASYLASYADDMLRNTLKDASESDSGIYLNQFIELFRYLTDKDIFENCYKNLLSKRLLSDKYISYDLEKAMIAKLKAECGYLFTSKLEGMFTDMQLSKDTMSAFRESTQFTQLPPRTSSSDAPRTELDVRMLTAGYWPVKATAPCCLPTIVNTICEKFSSFYLQKYEGRKLTWITHHGAADVRANYPSDPKLSKDFTVSTFQMCILLMFNKHSTLSLQEIIDGVNCQDIIEFKRHLLSLCTSKVKILIKKSKGKGILSDDEFTFNVNFTSKFKRLKVPLISIKEISGDKEGDYNNSGTSALPVAVEEDRRHSVEASIVRVMKTRKALTHNELIAEVTRQLQARFTPSPVFIKKRIESLIERDYIDRDKGDQRMYKYLA